jgi:hypothetical protein
MNKRLAGKEAGYMQKNRLGRPRCIQVNMKNCAPTAHRIIWEMQNGPIPDGMMVDHKNGDPWDNRVSNLRLATRSQNAQNCIKGLDNKSGYKGVSRTRRVEKCWMAQISVGGKKLWLGSYRTAEDAHAAYVEAAQIHHGAFAKTK